MRRLLRLGVRLAASGWIVLLTWAVGRYLLALVETRDGICIGLALFSAAVGAITLSAAFLLTWGRINLGGQLRTNSQLRRSL